MHLITKQWTLISTFHKPYQIPYFYLLGIGSDTDGGWTIRRPSGEPLEELFRQEGHERTEQPKTIVQTCIEGVSGDGLCLLIAAVDDGLNVLLLRVERCPDQTTTSCTC